MKIQKRKFMDYFPLPAYQWTLDDIYPGQPLLDAKGVMGQIVHAGPYTSTAVLITDPSHAIPVQVNRNGLRSIALGSGTIKCAIEWLALEGLETGEYGLFCGPLRAVGAEGRLAKCIINTSF